MKSIAPSDTSSIHLGVGVRQCTQMQDLLMEGGIRGFKHHDNSSLQQLQAKACSVAQSDPVITGRRQAGLSLYYEQFLRSFFGNLLHGTT